MTTTARVTASTSRRPLRDSDYPETDFQPMGETDLHITELIRLLETLRLRYRDAPDVYVGADMFIYFAEGDNRARARVVPDVFVVPGVPREPMRRTWLMWREKVPPAFVIEVTSRKTRTRDVLRKPAIYAALGVAEYVMYDPGGEYRYLHPPLQGVRLADGAYQPMPMDGDGALLSDALDLRLRLVEGRLRFEERATGQELLSPAEALAAERQARQSLEAEVARLRALLGDTRAGERNGGRE
jgi:Uma2 family endonuclease